MDGEHESTTLLSMPPPPEVASVAGNFSVGCMVEQFKSFSLTLTKGSLPAPWSTFIGAKVTKPYAVTTLDLLASRLARNASMFGINYLMIGLAASVFRICISPSLLFLSGCIVLLCLAHQSKSFERFGINQSLSFRITAVATFIVVCIVGPEALAWGVGIGGSVSVAHASLRNDSSHKNDDELSEDDAQSTPPFESRDLISSHQSSETEISKEKEAGEHHTPEEMALAPALFFDPESQNAAAASQDSDKGE